MMRPGTRFGAAAPRWRLRLVSAMPDTMRRWLTLFLIVFLPLQLSWAGISASGQHETAATARDVRQHNHQHQVAADQGDHNDQTVASDMEVDSASCHAQGCASAIFGAVHLSALSASTDAHIAYQIRVLPPPPPSLPERPNWADLA